MSTARVPWETAFAPGFAGVAVVLVEGVPVILTPSGVRPTTVAVTSGTVDPLFWPGTGALAITRPDSGTLDPVFDVLDADAEWAIHEETQPVDGTALVEPLRFDLFDVGGEITELLSNRDGVLARGLAADIGETGDIPLDSILSVPSGGGYLHIGREAVGYTALSGNDAVTSGTGAGRGLFGSRARAHVAGTGTRRPLVTVGAYPRSWNGRMASVWLCALSSDGATLTDPTLVYLGILGAGAQLVSKLTRWQLVIDHAVGRLSRSFDKAPVKVFGIQHALETMSPLSLTWDGVDHTLPPTFRGGWSADAVEFVRGLDNYATGTLTAGVRFGFTGGRVRMTATGPGGDVNWGLYACWTTPTLRLQTSENLGENTELFPAAVMHLDGACTIADPASWDRIPATFTWEVTTPATGRANLALVAETDHADELFGRIVGRDGTTQTLSLQALVDAPPPGTTESIAREAASRITTPTTASIGVEASGETAVGALMALTVALDSLSGSTLAVSAIAWEEIARVFAGIPLGAIPEARSYRFTGDEDSLIEPLIHEARLRGAALCVRRGLISVYRPASFASTELARAAIVEEDLIADSSTEVVENIEPVATAMTFALPAEQSYTFRDTTSADEYGEGKTIECDALKAADRTIDVSALTLDLAGFASQLLGVLSQPQRIIRITVGPCFWHLDAGDLVTLTHPEIPDFAGGRGLDAAVCQVMESRRSFNGGKASTQLGLRLAVDPDLAGYAPSAFVSPGGIAGAVVAADTAGAWGSNGFCADVDVAGGTVTNQPLRGFAVGDKVALSQSDVDTVTVPDELFTIVAITATTVTLDGSPTAPMAAAAGSRYGCLLRFAPWTDSDVTDRQRAYLFIGDHTTETLGASDTPKRWAA